MPLTGSDANVLGGMKQANTVQMKKKEHWQLILYLKIRSGWGHKISLKNKKNSDIFTPQTV